ncbi:MAG: hypothetical protein EKK41_29170 [Hyphomicrobiales bacterium]|nr:MAG: hypothetical protein EKK41_29170 [Hyphomicrobiales bacterium]
MRWLWGIIPLLILGWLAVEAEHTRIERDLADRAQSALQAGGLAWAASAFQGRDGVLSGKASDISDPDKALQLLGNVWGVRVVDNRADLIEQVENYNWAASRKSNRVRLSGYVPNQAAKQTILGMARANFPGFDIQDRMRLARGVPSVDTWLGGVSYGLKQLTYIQRGDVRLDALSFSASGEAEDAGAYRTLRSISNSLPKGIKLASANITPPTVSPHVFTARFDGKALALKGFVPSDADEAHVIAAAREKLPESAVSDDAEPGAGAATGWKDAAALIVRQLVRLENGQAEIKDGLVTISGLAADDEVMEAARQSLKGLPPAFKVIDHLQAKPKPKPVEQLTLAPVPPPPTAPDLQPKAQEPAEKKETPLSVSSTSPVVPPPAAAPAPAAPPRQAEPKPEPKPTPPPAVTAPPSPVAKAPPAPPPSPAQIKAAKACEDNLSGLAAAGTILFRYGSAEVSQTSFETLEKLATAAKDCPGMTIEIGGFASAEGSPFANLRLSESRAQSVLNFLVKAGVDARQLEAKGYGIARPAAPNTTPENMAKNRRIEFSVRPKAETR